MYEDIFLEGYYDALNEIDEDNNDDYDEAFMEGYYAALNEIGNPLKAIGNAINAKRRDNYRNKRSEIAQKEAHGVVSAHNAYMKSIGQKPSYDSSVDSYRNLAANAAAQRYDDKISSKARKLQAKAAANPTLKNIQKANKATAALQRKTGKIFGSGYHYE